MKKIIIECVHEMLKLNIPELEVFNEEWQQELNRMDAKPEIKKLVAVMTAAVINWKKGRIL